MSKKIHNTYLIKKLHSRNIALVRTTQGRKLYKEGFRMKSGGRMSRKEVTHKCIGQED